MNLSYYKFIWKKPGFEYVFNLWLKNIVPQVVGMKHMQASGTSGYPPAAWKLFANAKLIELPLQIKSYNLTNYT